MSKVVKAESGIGMRVTPHESPVAIVLGSGRTDHGDHHNMSIEQTSLEGVLVITPRVFKDDRGSFTETFNLRRFVDGTGVHREWVQDNESISARGVLRGLHFQNPHAQGKLVRCVRGAVFDVAVDIRRSSATFSDWVGYELSESNHAQLWIPEGFAHGFYALTDDATLNYKTTDYYNATADGTIRWDDPQIGIEWPFTSEPIVSGKDQAAPALSEAHVFE
jgi:dTDP-4-dehydrorhamnose 3,5-epimerase